MATATLNLTRQLSRKTNENGSKAQNATYLEDVAAKGADYFEIIAQATNDAVRDWDVTSGALTWPRGLENLSGYERSAASDQIGFWFSHIHSEDLKRIQNSLRDAFAGSDVRWMGEYRFRRADGEYAHILERALIFRDPAGVAVRVVGPMMDVTTRKQLQAEACRSQRMEAFGQLAGGVAHDFNNFLTTILGYSDLLLSEPAVKGQVASQIKEIRDAAGRASTLTNQLLAFSRRQALEPTVLEVNRLITNLERTLLRLLGDNISIVSHLHQLQEGAHIKVDAGQLTQIILNLAVNARDAMRKGGRLTLETSTLVVSPGMHLPCPGADLSPGEYVSIAVTDNGTGMRDEVKARLFEPFFTTKDEGRSSGLGLATSYGIVRQSGGHICAESELGKGSTFRIFLPRVAAPLPASYKKPGQRKSLTGTETILVLEDEVSVRHLSVRVLRNLGYEVLEAAHGDDAKRLIAKRGAQKIDLLLTDMVMPEISGRHFADWLGKANPETKVIFISGYLEESMHPGDRRDPGMCFLAKPFSADQLASKVREALDGEV
jgi:two-component system, cell cycle sensor histidine kinase and response regulator CckA